MFTVVTQCVDSWCNMEMRGAEMPSGMNELDSAHHKSLRWVCNPCDSTALPCWGGNETSGQETWGEVFTLFLRVSGQYCKGSILGTSSFGVQKAREELLSGFCAVCVIQATPRCVTRVLSSAFLNAMEKTGVFRYCVLLSTLLHFSETQDKQIVLITFIRGCFKTEYTLCKSNRKIRSWWRCLWFWEVLNKPDSETWL